MLCTRMMIDPEILDKFEPISLREMGKVKLMNRIDTKFVASIGRVAELLRRAAADYRIQQIDGRRNMPYYTRYFDTDDTDMFYQHQRGKKNRQKVRIRHYEECNMLPFIEIKSKNNKGRTHKDRIIMDRGDALKSYEDFLSLHTPYSLDSLVPHIENHFYRITLVNKDMTERVTIDSNLDFHNLTNGKKISMHDLGIIEWKRDGRKTNSPLADILKDLRIHPSGFSKYCIGMAVTTPGLKQNRLKPRLRKLNLI